MSETSPFRPKSFAWRSAGEFDSAAGDVIVRIGEALVRHPQDARSIVIGEPGTPVAIEIVRNGHHEVLDLKLGTVPRKRAP